MNQPKLFDLPFDDVNTGDQFYCEATNTTYTVVWMFTGFFNGCLLVRTHLDTNFSEVCDYAKQKSHNSAMEEIAGPTRKIAACLAFLYYMDPEDQAKEKEEATQNKEQVKRQKACPFCRDDSVEKEWNLIETPDEGIPVTWINGNVLETENYDSTLGCPIKFCPMCGRRLESEDDDD